MTRRIIFIILGALALALVVGLLWFWFFSGRGAPAPQGGTFGAGTTKTTNVGTDTDQNNISSGVNGGSSSGTNVALNTGTGQNTAGGSTGSAFAQSNGTGVQGVNSVPGVDWLGGTGGTSGLGGNTTSFVPKNVNELNQSTVGGSPGIIGTFGNNAGANGNAGLAVGGIIGAGAGCAAYFAFQGLGALDAGKDALTPNPLSLGGGYVLVMDFNANKKQSTNEFKNVGDCLARTIGRAVIAQMTNSIINWINSGFNGQPSFVTNFQQYFTNVGDQAAGEFIRGTALSFLCSPFQLQIKIAIAQSYARRNNAASCTLTGIVKNVNGFMSGNFSQGGWAGLLQFTTVPTNNPYGAYAYAQIGLASAQNSAINDANRNVTPGGFISLQKESNCITTSGPPAGGTKPGQKTTPIEGGLYRTCDMQVGTPGSVIEASLNKTLEQPFLANQLAQSFDQIISALMNQLVTKTLYSGLSSLSGQNGYAANYLTPEQQQAQDQAQTMITDMQSRVQVSQQYGSVGQGSIQDIQGAQQQLQGLANCWASKDKAAQASSTIDLLHTYDSQIDSYNSQITRANQSIARLQALQTQVLNVVTPADVAAAQGAYQSALASGAIITQADVTQAQQDRNLLQSNLAGRNNITKADLANCNAL